MASRPVRCTAVSRPTAASPNGISIPRASEPCSGASGVAHGAAAERIAYPADIARIRVEDPRCAREIQQSNGEKFLDAFGRGLAVTGFERSRVDGTYLLEPYE